MKNTTFVGIVKAIITKDDPTKDFGFIQPEGTKAAYGSGIHFNVLRSEEYKTKFNSTCAPGLNAGDKVSFEVTLDNMGRQTCINVKLIKAFVPHFKPTTSYQDPALREVATGPSSNNPHADAIRSGVEKMSEAEPEEPDEEQEYEEDPESLLEDTDGSEDSYSYNSYASYDEYDYYPEERRKGVRRQKGDK